MSPKSRLTLVKGALLALILVAFLVPGSLGAVEDLSTWTESDTAGTITVNATAVYVEDFHAIDDGDRVWLDAGAGNIGDFIVYYDLFVSKIASSTSPANKGVIVGVSQQLDDVRDATDQTYTMLRSLGGGVNYAIHLVSERSGANTVQASGTLTAGTWYYIIFSKTGVDLGVYIYSNEARTVLVTSAEIEATGDDTNRYWMVYNSADFNSGGNANSMTIRNVDLEAGEAGTSISINKQARGDQFIRTPMWTQANITISNGYIDQYLLSYDNGTGWYNKSWVNPGGSPAWVLANETMTIGTVLDGLNTWKWYAQDENGTSYVSQPNDTRAFYVKRDLEENPFTLPQNGGDGATHPQTWYFPEGLDGYDYWMYYTPFPPAGVEEPFLVRSNNVTAEGWRENGVSNPLWEATEGWESDHLYDPDMVYDDNLDHPFQAVYGAEGPPDTFTIASMSSDDGLTWVNKTQIVNNTRMENMIQVAHPGWTSGSIATPALHYESGQFYMWINVRVVAGGEDVGMVYILSGPDLDETMTLLNPEPVFNHTNPDNGHIDVLKTGDNYFLMWQGFSDLDTLWDCSFGIANATELDGAFIEFGDNPIMWFNDSYSESWEENGGLYRPSLTDINGTMYLFYSAHGSIGNNHEIGWGKVGRVVFGFAVPNQPPDFSSVSFTNLEETGDPDSIYRGNGKDYLLRVMATDPDGADTIALVDVALIFEDDTTFNFTVSGGVLTTTVSNTNITIGNLVETNITSTKTITVNLTFAITTPRSFTQYLIGRANSVDNGSLASGWHTYNQLANITDIPNRPPVVTVTGPTEGALYYHGFRPTITWTSSDPDPGDSQGSYQVQVDNDSDFTSITHDSGKVGTGAETYQISVDLSAVVTYYYRDYLWDNHDLVSEASASRTFDIGHRLEVRYHNSSGPLAGLQVTVTQGVSGEVFSGPTNNTGHIRTGIYDGENTTLRASGLNASFASFGDFYLVLNPGLVGSGGPAGPAPGAYALYNFYNISSASLPTGTNTSGGTYDLRAKDGSSQVVTEVAGVPGFDVRYNWTGLPDNLTALNLFMFGTYNGNPAHTVHIHVYNQVDEAWTPLLGTWESAGGAHWLNVSWSQYPDEFVLDGELWVQMLHETTGTPGHTLTLDYVQLRGAVPVLSGGLGLAIPTTWSLWILFLVNVVLCSWFWLFDGPLESGVLAMVALISLAWVWLINAGAVLKPVALIFGLLAVYAFLQVFAEAWEAREAI